MRGTVVGMARKLVIELSDGSREMLEQVPAEHELQLQEKLKTHPELLPLEDLGLAGPAVVVGRESTPTLAALIWCCSVTVVIWRLLSSRPARRIQTFASAWRSYWTTGLICGE
jgi:hypothetical protein